MRKYLPLGVVCVALAAVGWYLYARPFQAPPPAPKDLTLVLPKQLLDKASPAELAVLRGEAASAPKNSGTRVAKATATPSADVPDAVNIPGLTVTLSRDQPGPLRGKAVNSTKAAVKYAYRAGTLYSNGVGDVVLLKDISVDVPPMYSTDLELPVSVTRSDKGVLVGGFTPHAGDADRLQGLLSLFKLMKMPSLGAMQTAVLAINENVPLDEVAKFPRLRPPALAGDDDRPFRVSSQELIEALTLLRDSGFDVNSLAMMGEPQLKAMTILDPQSHVAAMRFFGVAEADAWGFWKTQLLAGDPSLRHFALFGIARYYPDVALRMLPEWVREKNMYREFRLSAAWALSLVEDPRARQALFNLQEEMKGDPGLKQAIDRALQHLDSSSNKVADASAR